MRPAHVAAVAWRCVEGWGSCIVAEGEAPSASPSTCQRWSCHPLSAPFGGLPFSWILVTLTGSCLSTAYTPPCFLFIDLSLSHCPVQHPPAPLCLLALQEAEVMPSNPNPPQFLKFPALYPLPLSCPATLHTAQQKPEGTNRPCAVNSGLENQQGEPGL